MFGNNIPGNVKLSICRIPFLGIEHMPACNPIVLVPDFTSMLNSNAKQYNDLLKSFSGRDPALLSREVAAISLAFDDLTVAVSTSHLISAKVLAKILAEIGDKARDHSLGIQKLEIDTRSCLDILITSSELITLRLLDAKGKPWDQSLRILNQSYIRAISEQEERMEELIKLATVLSTDNDILNNNLKNAEEIVSQEKIDYNRIEERSLFEGLWIETSRGRFKKEKQKENLELLRRVSLERAGATKRLLGIKLKLGEIAENLRNLRKNVVGITIKNPGSDPTEFAALLRNVRVAQGRLLEVGQSKQGLSTKTRNEMHLEEFEKKRNSYEIFAFGFRLLEEDDHQFIKEHFHPNVANIILNQNADFTIHDAKHGGDMYAAHSYDSRRRHVFRWVGENKFAGNQWKLQWKSHDETFLILNADLSEYLFACDAVNYDDRRKYVFTDRTKATVFMDNQWRLEPVYGGEEFLIFNTHHDQYIGTDDLGPDSTKRYVFAWRKAKTDDKSIWRITMRE